ncbi:MAG: tRNA (N6-isopentenyl adenosine(37)-C2)-methylthiotransferase MiaB, partial [Planctomycetota bacterium]|nr:tRNA (N6-isopentenyl adenosine(37)-C2)-methylthiotransferase MiaB [Planctomycetota bacterium]
GTKGAALYPDDIPEEIKKRRNNEMLDLQNSISEEDNQAFVGRTVEILVEGPSKSNHKFHEPDSDILQLTGRTECDRIVVYEGNRRQIGQLIPVTVYEAAPHTLFGAVVTRQVGPEVYTLAPPAP